MRESLFYFSPSFLFFLPFRKRRKRGERIFGDFTVTIFIKCPVLRFDLVIIYVLRKKVLQNGPNEKLFFKNYCNLRIFLLLYVQKKRIL